MDICFFCCFDDFLIICIKLSVCYVFAYRSVEQKYVLRYNPDILPQTVAGDVAYVPAVQRYPAEFIS